MNFDYDMEKSFYIGFMEKILENKGINHSTLQFHYKRRL